MFLSSVYTVVPMSGVTKPVPFMNFVFHVFVQCLHSGTHERCDQTRIVYEFCCHAGVGAVNYVARTRVQLPEQWDPRSGCPKVLVAVFSLIQPLVSKRIAGIFYVLRTLPQRKRDEKSLQKKKK